MGYHTLDRGGTGASPDTLLTLGGDNFIIYDSQGRIYTSYFIWSTISLTMPPSLITNVIMGKCDLYQDITRDICIIEMKPLVYHLTTIGGIIHHKRKIFVRVPQFYPIVYSPVDHSPPRSEISINIKMLSYKCIIYLLLYRQGGITNVVSI